MMCMCVCVCNLRTKSPYIQWSMSDLALSHAKICGERYIKDLIWVVKLVSGLGTYKTQPINA